MPTPLRDIVVTVQVAGLPPNEVLTATAGEWEPLHGVNHVSVFAPYATHNGGPGSMFRYRVRARITATGQPIELQSQWFLGYAPHTQAARFADQQ